MYQHLPGGTDQFRDISQSGYLPLESGFETEACQIRSSSVTVSGRSASAAGSQLLQDSLSTEY